MKYQTGHLNEESAARRRSRRVVHRCVPVLFSLALALGSEAGAGAADSNPSKLPPVASSAVDFARDIKPLLESSCVKCHGPEKAKNGFRLDSRAHALAGGDNGVDIIPGDSGKSPLVHYVAGLVPDLEMPPKGKGEAFTTKQVGLLRAWIDQGAKWDREELASTKSVDKSDWWSLKPLTKPPVPNLVNRKSQFVIVLHSPRYASMTFLFARTSAGVPSAIFTP